MDLAYLLNSPEPDPPLVDISAQLASLATFLGPGNIILATPHVQAAFVDLVTRLVPVPTLPTTPQPPPNIPLDHLLAISVQHNVVVNQKVTVSELYKYPLGVSVEYPESSAQGVGHLFQIALEDWSNPTLDFLYSKGEPHGHSRSGEEVNVPFLTDANLYPAKDIQLQHASPTRDIFHKTGAFIAALRKQRCPAPRQEETYFDSDEEEEQLAKEEHQAKIRRGYVPSIATCEGSSTCEHYSKTNNKDHYFNASINDGSFDVNYLTAVFEENQEEIDYIAMHLASVPEWNVNILPWLWTILNHPILARKMKPFSSFFRRLLGKPWICTEEDIISTANALREVKHGQWLPLARLFDGSWFPSDISPSCSLLPTLGYGVGNPSKLGQSPTHPRLRGWES
ncbi:hypothetical protein B0H17DRAFT_1138922 [Mycena rosella]|uniref:Uncharacterized protein n=1 Tax=Mycena rosella TaxID=1033263 RepID=A0AAD7G9F9_MYCRO|nr:hypothetical protein B0H17DRAFT_1138922 [Mycena rosella]